MSNVIMCSDCKKCDGDRCTYFDNDSDRESTIACILFEPKKPTIFDRITASPEVLAPYCISTKPSINGDTLYYYSTVTGHIYLTESEAIAATVAKLKEVCDE